MLSLIFFCARWQRKLKKTWCFSFAISLNVWRVAELIVLTFVIDCFKLFDTIQLILKSKEDNYEHVTECYHASRT